MNEDLLKIFHNILPIERVQLDITPKTSTTGFCPQIACVLMPHTRTEVESIVKTCVRNNLVPYPISAGRNWGYSDSYPDAQGRVLIDLSGMNRIISYDPNMAVVTIEPGVTQRQLYEFLKSNGNRHIISPTGSSPDTSIVGNYLERGFGLTPVIDHANAVTSLEAVLPDGTIYQGILSRLGCEEIDRLCRTGPGPYEDGLFFQSRRGIVTRMTIKLAPRPESAIIIAAHTGQDRIEHLINVLRTIRQTWDTPSLSIKIFSPLYVMAASGASCPEPYAGGGKPLPDDVLTRIRRDKDIADYTLTLTFTGPAGLTKIMARNITEKLRPLTDAIKIIDNLKYNLAMRFGHTLPAQMRARLPVLSVLWGYLHGVPSDYMLRFAYWRHRDPAIRESNDKTNPARDGCGLIWYAPIMPFSADGLKRLESFIYPVCQEYGFDCPFNFTNYNDSYVVALIPLIFDPKTESERAQSCYFTLLERGLAAGFAPYRVPSFAASRLESMMETSEK